MKLAALILGSWLFGCALGVVWSQRQMRGCTCYPFGGREERCQVHGSRGNDA